MKWICHRGNINGPNPNDENKPAYIQTALSAGYDVEIDVWLKSDGLYLGHDFPTYKVDLSFLRNKRLWLHCKNIEAFAKLKTFPDTNCFMQDSEPHVKTTRGYTWNHSKTTTWEKNTVFVSLAGHFPKPKLFSKEWFCKKLYGLPFAICADYMLEPSRYSLPFDLLILDIDGVMTDSKVYDANGKVFGKAYCDLDFTAIKRFLAAGVKVCFLSGDMTVNKAMAETRKIDFFHNMPGVDKAELFYKIKEHYNAKTVAYVGDDYYDIGIMSLANIACCPASSPKAVRKAANKLINVQPGKGVIAGLYDLFDSQIAYTFPVDSPDVNPK